MKGSDRKLAEAAYAEATQGADPELRAVPWEKLDWQAREQLVRFAGAIRGMVEGEQAAVASAPVELSDRVIDLGEGAFAVNWGSYFGKQAVFLEPVAMPSEMGAVRPNT